MARREKRRRSKVTVTCDDGGRSWSRWTHSLPLSLEAVAKLIWTLTYPCGLGCYGWNEATRQVLWSEEYVLQWPKRKRRWIGRLQQVTFTPFAEILPDGPYYLKVAELDDFNKWPLRRSQRSYQMDRIIWRLRRKRKKHDYSTGLRLNLQTNEIHIVWIKMQMIFAIRYFVWKDCMDNEVDTLLLLRRHSRAIAKSNFVSSHSRSFLKGNYMW